MLIMERTYVIILLFSDTQHSLLILHLIALMCERLGESILKNPSQMLIFIESTLKRACAIMHADEEGLGTAFITETLTMALGMLSAMLGGAVEVILCVILLSSSPNTCNSWNKVVSNHFHYTDRELGQFHMLQFNFCLCFIFFKPNSCFISLHPCHSQFLHSPPSPKPTLRNFPFEDPTQCQPQQDFLYCLYSSKFKHPISDFVVHPHFL